MDKGIFKIAAKIAEGGKNVIFTGAGISTESGIPDYRSKGGIWDRYQPVYFDEFMSSKEKRIEYWQEKSELYPDLKKAQPNPAHLAISWMHEQGFLDAVITQNIDGLHQKSGLPDEKVIELHGNTTRVRCMSCSRISSIDDAQKRIDAGDLAPECECGGYLKPDTVSFGQAMPVEEMTNAMNAAQTCDTFIVIGSTLVVHPAASLPGIAKQNGALLAIINLSETPCDAMADVLLSGKAGEIMPEIVAEIKKII